MSRRISAVERYATDMYDVLVIGAGLAGLTSGRILKRSGLDVLLLEASSEVGGRVRSFRQDGVILDAGYQVLFPAYPAVRRHLDLPRLDLVNLAPAAVLRQGRHTEVLGHPVLDPLSMWSVGGNALGEAITELGLLLQDRESALSNMDKGKIVSLIVQMKSRPPYTLLRGKDESTEAYLRRKGLSQRAIDLFFRPFFGGIFLNRELSTSARLFRYYFRMLMDAGAALPRAGMGAITQQLSEGLHIKNNVNVTHLESYSHGSHVCVYTSTEEIYKAKQVIVATDPATAQQLIGERLGRGDLAHRSLSSHHLHYWAPEALDSEHRLILNSRLGWINNAHWISNAIPERTPNGGHLLTVTVLGPSHHVKHAHKIHQNHIQHTQQHTYTSYQTRPDHLCDDQMLDANVRYELETWYTPDAVSTLKTLKIERIQHAQFAQFPNYVHQLAGHATRHAGVYFASELTSMSGIQGAMESGEKAAALVLNDMLGLSRSRGS